MRGTMKYRMQNAECRIGRERAVCRYDDRRTKAPSDEGKQSAVAVVNDSPVDCQSRDRIARRQLSAEQADWGREKALCYNCFLSLR